MFTNMDRLRAGLFFAVVIYAVAVSVTDLHAAAKQGSVTKADLLVAENLAVRIAVKIIANDTYAISDAQRGSS